MKSNKKKYKISVLYRILESKFISLPQCKFSIHYLRRRELSELRKKTAEQEIRRKELEKLDAKRLLQGKVGVQ